MLETLAHTPELVSFNALDKSLESNSVWAALPKDAKIAFYELYLDQLQKDFAQQQKIITTGILSKPSVSPVIQEKAQEALKTLQRNQQSPALLDAVTIVESQIKQTWDRVIPELLSAYTAEVDLAFQHSPANEEEDYKYARMDAFKHPIVKALQAEIAKVLQLDEQNLPLLIPAASNLPKTLTDILNRLRFTPNWLSQEHSNPFRIIMLNTAPYFETHNTLLNTAHPHSMKDNVATFAFPSGDQQKEFGPTIITQETHVNSPHIWWLDRLVKQETGMTMLFAEPIGNNTQLDTPDLKKTIATLEANLESIDTNTHKIIFCLDSTLLGGLINPLEMFPTSLLSKITVVVFESMVKFLGYGSDKSNLGVVYGGGTNWTELRELLKARCREQGMSGMVHEAANFPLPNKEILAERRDRFTLNAQLLVEQLTQLKQKVDITVSYGTEIKDYDFGGNLIFIGFPAEEIMVKVIDQLQQSQLIHQGTSYGFNTTRFESIIQIDPATHQPWYGIRLSVGTENWKQMLEISDLLKTAISSAQPVKQS